VWPRDGRDAPTLMRNADTALYRAKNQGRNRFCFYARQADLPAEAGA
jgi:PleD family two-component response regulator